MVAIYHIDRDGGQVDAEGKILLQATPIASFLTNFRPVTSLRLATYDDHIDVTVHFSPALQTVREMTARSPKGPHQLTVFQLSQDSRFGRPKGFELNYQDIFTHPLAESRLLWW